MTKARILSDLDPASQAEAEAGTENTKYMTPLRVNEAVQKRVHASGTEAEKPASPEPGMIYHNTDNNGQLEFYRDAAGGWRELIDEYSSGQSLKNKRFEGPNRTETHAASWTGAVTFEPGDGAILVVTLTGNVTAVTDNFSDEESMLILIDDGTGYTLTWPAITWLSDDGVAPTLRTTGLTSVLLWKDGTTLYGFCGNGG